jgi:hypothetical protein
MKEKLLFVSNIFVLALTTLVLATIQSSLWFQIFGWFPPPAFWIPVLVYVSLYRSPTEAVVVVFVLSLILSTMTVIPDSLLFMTCLLLGASVRLVKQRFYWAGASYFMIVCGFAALVWHVYHWLGSMVASDMPLTSPEVIDWLIQAMLTPLVAPPLYNLFRWFDKVTDREQPVEASTDML